MTKIAGEVMAQAVDLIGQGYRPDDVAASVGISRSTAYRLKGVFSPRARTSGGNMAAAIVLLQGGASLRSTSAATGVPYGTVRKLGNRHGVPIERNIGFTGLPDVVARLEAKGFRVRVMPHSHIYDLEIDGVPCELKCSNLYTQKNGCAQYSFSLAGSASGARESFYVRVVNGIAFKDYSRTCKFLICAGFVNGKLQDLYRIGSSEIRYMRRNFKINPGGHKYDDYKI